MEAVGLYSYLDGPARDPHQLALMATARSLGIETVDQSHLGVDAVDYCHGGRVERVLMGQAFSHLTGIASIFCDDKLACKSLLAAHDVPVPRGIAPSGPEDPAIAVLLAEGGNWVVKPRVGEHGKGVVVGLRSLDAVQKAMREGPPGPYLVEAQVAGEDLRLQAVGGRLVAACRRVPASITGDGQQPVRALIEARREVVRRANPANDLRIDGEVMAHLEAAGLTLDDIVPAGREVVLRGVANMSSGARAIDVTDELHADWIDLMQCIGEMIGIRVFSVDAVTADASRPPAFGAVLEVNARPDWLHHTFSERRQHDIPRLLLEDLFGLDGSGEVGL